MATPVEAVPCWAARVGVPFWLAWETVRDYAARAGDTQAILVFGAVPVIVTPDSSRLAAFAQLVALVGPAVARDIVDRGREEGTGFEAFFRVHDPVAEYTLATPPPPVILAPSEGEPPSGAEGDCG